MVPVPNTRQLARGVVAIVSSLAAACAGNGQDLPVTFDGAIEVDASIAVTPFADPDCTGGFSSIDLPHETQTRGAVSALGDGTGTGVLAEDLDDDGRIDLVFPNLSGDTAVLWGRDDGTTFERSVVATGRFRQAVTLDIDSDGDRDLVFTTGLGPPQVYLRSGDTWDRTEVRDLRLLAYSAAPGDLEGDGDVDLAFGSYNAELTAARDSRVLNGIDVGTAVYRPASDETAGRLAFDEELLSTSAQALVTLVIDIDGDGRDDVVAGNDLGTPDRVWLGSTRGLTFTELFDITTLSTMSIDVADLDNDGDRDVVATDMAPMPDEPVEPWAELAADIEAARTDEIQQPRNMLQLASATGFTEVAVDQGVDATGWSWAGLLGDLDNDGRLDLHVVNGMRAPDIFPDLPDGELVEANQAFRNTADGFTEAPEWGLDATTGGRGMAMADLDTDGDLDIIVSNLGAPATLHLNGLCGGTSVEVELAWSGVQNRDALGATVVVDDGDTRRERIITGARGYISSGPTRAHIGLGDRDDPGADDTVDIAVRWPDGAVSRFDDIAPGNLVTVTRSASPITGDGA